jgi:multidrug efflux pump subunit AcrA (membrane-fusion protein)
MLKGVTETGLIQKLALLIAGLAAALACCACSRTQTARAEDLNASGAPTVAVAKAGIEDISHGIVLTGEFKPFQEIDVMAKVSGYVKKINVDVGDHVQEGQLLALIEVPEMFDDQARAQSMLNRSQAEVARARDELQRAESSHMIAHLSYTRISEVANQRAGLIAQQEIDDARSRTTGPGQLRGRSEVENTVRVHAGNGAICGIGHQAVRRHGFDDPGRHLFEHAGDAGCKAVGKHSASPDFPGS